MVVDAKKDRVSAIIFAKTALTIKFLAAFCSLQAAVNVLYSVIKCFVSLILSQSTFAYLDKIHDAARLFGNSSVIASYS